MNLPTTCLNEDKKIIYARGLCRNCYKEVNKAVLKKVRTWIELEEFEVCLPAHSEFFKERLKLRPNYTGKYINRNYVAKRIPGVKKRARQPGESDFYYARQKRAERKGGPVSSIEDHLIKIKYTPRIFKNIPPNPIAFVEDVNPGRKSYSDYLKK